MEYSCSLCSGGLAGSLMLNKRFEEWVKDIVGERAYIELRETNGYRLAMKQFDESIKPAFRSRDDENQYINFPMANVKDDPAKRIKSNCITLTGYVHVSAFPTNPPADSKYSGMLSTRSLVRCSEKLTSSSQSKSTWSTSSV